MDSGIDNRDSDKSFPAEDIISFINYFSGPNMVTFMTDLNDKYPMTYLAKPDNACPYSIYNLDDGRRLYVFFDEEYSLKEVVYFFVVDEILEKSAFDSLEAGMTLADVEAVDNGTKYINSVNAYSLNHGMTVHMVRDGFIKIKYSGGEFDPQTAAIKDLADFIIETVEFIPNGSEVIGTDFNPSNHFGVLENDYTN